MCHANSPRYLRDQLVDRVHQPAALGVDPPEVRARRRLVRRVVEVEVLLTDLPRQRARTRQHRGRSHESRIEGGAS